MTMLTEYTILILYSGGQKYKKTSIYKQKSHWTITINGKMNVYSKR